MKQMIILLSLAVLIILFIGVFYYRYEQRIHNYLSAFSYNRQRQKVYNMMHEKRVDITNLPALDDEEDAWYTKYHTIAHAGGGIDGRTYTNSLEAWEYSYSRGARVIDADCSFTTDSVLVLRHEWRDNLEQTYVAKKDYQRVCNENTDFKTFMSRKIFHLYSPMSCEMLIRFMQKHNDVYVATDMKGKDVIKSYRYLVNVADKLDAKNVLDRIIVNLYEYDNYEQVNKLYPFKNFNFRIHLGKHNYYEIAEFCLKNKIHVVNVWNTFMEDEGIQLLLSKNIHVITAVVDYISDLHEYRKLGSTGCVSNFIYEDIYHLSD